MLQYGSNIEAYWLNMNSTWKLFNMQSLKQYGPNIELTFPRRQFDQYIQC